MELPRSGSRGWVWNVAQTRLARKGLGVMTGIAGNYALGDEMVPGVIFNQAYCLRFLRRADEIHRVDYRPLAGTVGRAEFFVLKRFGGTSHVHGFAPWSTRDRRWFPSGRWRCHGRGRRGSWRGRKAAWRTPRDVWRGLVPGRSRRLLGQRRTFPKYGY